MNGVELAKELHVSARKARNMIRLGIIKAKKRKGVWDVDVKDFRRFQKNNHTKIQRLKAEYIALYWAGLGIETLQRRVKEDFTEKAILYPPGSLHHFAEQTIYESLLQEKEERT